MHTSLSRFSASTFAIAATSIAFAPLAGAQMIQFPEGFPFTTSIVNAAPVNTINNGNSFNAAINQAAPVVHVQQNPVVVSPVTIGSTGYKTTNHYVEVPTYKTTTYDRSTYNYKTVQYDRPTYKTVQYRQPEVRYVQQPRYTETVRYRQVSAQPIYVEPRIQYVKVLPQTGVESFTNAIASAGTALRPMAASAKEASASLWIVLSSMGMSAGAALGKKFLFA